MGTIGTLDSVVILTYFGAVFGIAYWASRVRKQSSSDYFLAGRNLGWLVVGASLFASNIGSEHLIGLAGSGASGGMAVGHFEWLATLILLLLGWLFVPFYQRSGVTTMPEFLELRYNGASRTYLAVVSVVGYVLTKISVSLYAGGLIIGQLTGLSIWTSAAIIVVLTGIYTVAGGLRAVIYTDTMQAFTLIVGSAVLTILGLNAIGGWEGLQASVPPDFFSMWKPSNHPDFPWTGIIFGAPILGVWYWCTDQYIVQRVLAAKNIQVARSATLFAGALKILPVFIFVMPGIIAYGLYNNSAGNVGDLALVTLATDVLPAGLSGLFMAGLLAALMSSLSSVFNSCSTIISWDFYKKMKPEATEAQLITVGRIATVVLVILGLLWIPLMKNISSQLYIYLQSVQAYIAPPIAACFLLGIFIPKLNGKGAISALLSGAVLGFLRLVLELVHGRDHMGLAAGSLWAWVAEINFLHFAILLFVISSVILIGVSLATGPPRDEQVAELTYAGVRAGEARAGLAKAPMDAQTRTQVYLSVALAATIGVLWIIFA